MRSFGRFSVAILWVTLLAAPSVVYAQGALSGVVKDSSGAVLPGVTVEAASPVLIEKVRTAVTDGNGRYQIVNLRPGAYTITFTLAGFNAVKRDGVTLAGTSAQVIDATMRVGALEETITVTGEAPTVDTTSTTKQEVLNSDAINALPSARNYFGLARMIPGTSGGGNDVGGSLIQDVGQSVTVHGSRNQDQRVTTNGVNTMTLQAGGNIGGQTPDVGSAAEVTVDTTSLSADLPTGGIRINFIPRDGGNQFSDSTFFSYSGSSMQGNNFSQELQDAGLDTPVAIIKNFDLNESIGGPIKRDKVWFWFSTRFNRVENEAGIFENANAFKPDEWLYVPDTSKPGVNKGFQQNNSLRVTWQATPKVKIAGTYKADHWCNCPSQIGPGAYAPEAGRDRRFPRLRQEHGEVTIPVTNRLLFEAVGMHLFERWGDMHLRVNGGSLTDPAQEAIMTQMISVQEQSTGLRYRNRNVNNNTVVPSFTYRAALSYVTGTHNVKFGFNNTNGYLREYQYVRSDLPVEYRFRDGVPNRITERAYPYQAKTDQKYDLGLFIQDKISLNKLTVNLAGRMDAFKSGEGEQHVGPSVLTPTRDITFPAGTNTNWKDLTYRSGIVYDINGDGKTAIKVAFNKYLRGQTLNGIGRSPNPVLSMVTQANRSWNDANQDYHPDCDLVNPLANGECGAIDNQNFGSTVAGTTYDPDLVSGWGHRETNWEFSSSIQRELAQGIAVDFGYFRRIWKNFAVTDNLSVSAADYTQFTMVLPTDPRIPGGGGTSVTLFDVNPEAFGASKDLNALNSKYGKQIEHWNGFDLTVNARLQNGLTMQAGVSSGKTIEDNCEIVAVLPEMNVTGGGGLPTSSRPAEYCHREEPMLTQFKAYGVYTIPTVDVQISGTFRSTPGASVNGAFTATNAYLAANSTLGRPLSGGRSNMAVQVLSQNSKQLDRRQELDMRFGKVLRFGKTRSVVSLDVFNLLNNDAVLTANQNYSAWLRPTSILNARLAKISVQFEF